MTTEPGVYRRKVLCGAALAGLPAMLMTPLAWGQAFPSTTIRIIVGNPPGGTVDLLARLIADDLSKAFGQPAIVENRPGANGNLAAEQVLKAPADGHTLFLAAPGPFVTHGALYKAMRFDPQTAFAPISIVAVAPLVLVVPSSLPVRSLRDFVAYAKSQPGKVSYGSQGNGSMGHLAMEMFKQAAGIYAVHVPYKGSAAAMLDLVGGNIQAMLDNTTSVLPHVKSGALRALAVAEKTRLPSLPEVPTLDESGWRGFEATPWFGIAASAATPRDAVQKLSAAVRASLRRPEAQAKLLGMGIQPRGTSVEEFEAVMKSDTAKWAAVIRASGATID